jgi:hypothetical protein
MPYRIRMMMAGLLLESGDLTPGAAADRIRTHFAKRRKEVSGKSDASALLEQEVRVMSELIERQRASLDPTRGDYWTAVHTDLFWSRKAA